MWCKQCTSGAGKSNFGLHVVLLNLKHQTFKSLFLALPLFLEKFDNNCCDLTVHFTCIIENSTWLLKPCNTINDHHLMASQY